MSGARRTARMWLAIAAIVCPSFGRPLAVPLSYRLAAGQSYTYETKVNLGGQLSRAARGAERHASAISWVAVERTRYDVVAAGTASDPNATVEMRLLGLEVSSTIPGRHGLSLEREAKGVSLKRGAGAWQLPLPESGQPTPDDIATKFGYDPAKLLAPVTLSVSPGGLVTVKSGTPWSQQLTKDEVFHSIATAFQPFGTGFLETPGRTLELGTEWQQPRTLALPGSGGETYRLNLLFSLAGQQPVGPLPAVRIEYEGATTVLDQPLKVGTTPGKTPLNLAALTSRIRGQALWDHARGVVVEHHLKTELASRAIRPGKEGEAPLLEIETELQLEADMLLLPGTR